MLGKRRQGQEMGQSLLHGIIMVKQTDEYGALTFDSQDLASQGLLDAVREDIALKY
jgi:hypothetical protein